jgi:hypothetical protein
MSVRSMKVRSPKRRGGETPGAASQVLEELIEITKWESSTCSFWPLPLVSGLSSGDSSD